MTKLKTLALMAAITGGMTGGATMTSASARAQDMSRGANNFYTSSEVTVRKVSFKTQYGLQVSGSLFAPFNDIETISPRPMLFITGDRAHSREFSEEAYKLAAKPKEPILVPGAGHVDLYDRVNLIPFEKLGAFFRANLTMKRGGTAGSTEVTQQRSRR